MNHSIKHPIFVVGLARSGTKLLRNLIANHPQLFIPPAETNFFAYFIRTVAIRNGRLRRNQIDVFKRYFYNSVFYYEMRFRGFGVSVNELEKCLSLPDWPSIFSCIIRTFIPASEKDAVAAWGDKTPVYLNHMLTLKKAFPSARFIHIVRDPRDRALSVSNAWNGDVLLAAERWRQQVANAQVAMKAFPDDYLEVKYEDLLDNPRAILESLCAFLQVPFDESVTQLGAPVENQGVQDSPTRTSAEIVNQNTRKYLGAFDDVVLRRMEEIALPMMLEKDYLPQANAIEYKPLDKSEAFLRSRKDDISSVLYHLHRFGLKNGTLFSFERFRIGRV